MSRIRSLDSMLRRDLRALGAQPRLPTQGSSLANTVLGTLPRQQQLSTSTTRSSATCDSHILSSIWFHRRNYSSSEDGRRSKPCRLCRHQERRVDSEIPMILDAHETGQYNSVSRITESRQVAIGTFGGSWKSWGMRCS